MGKNWKEYAHILKKIGDFSDDKLNVLVMGLTGRSLSRFGISFLI